MPDNGNFAAKVRLAVRLLADKRVEGNVGTVALVFADRVAVNQIRPMSMTRASAALLFSLLSALAACSGPSAMTANDAPVVATLIVKPRVATGDSLSVMKPIRETLGRAAGARYVRAMAGDAHIVHLTAPAQRGEVPQLIERLKASGAFQYVELDSMMKAQ